MGVQEKSFCYNLVCCFFLMFFFYPRSVFLCRFSDVGVDCWLYLSVVVVY
jgi:hypothetical protein